MHLNMALKMAVLGGGQKADTTIFKDLFTGADSTALNSHTPDKDLSAAGWTLVNGTWALSSNRAAPTGTAPGGLQWIAAADAGQPNLRITCTINTGSAGSNTMGVIVRRNAADNTFYLITIRDTSMQVWWSNGSTLSQVAISSVAHQTSTDYHLTITTNGAALTAADELTNISYTMLNNLNSTGIGIRGGNAAHRFDGLTVSPFSGAPAAASITLDSPTDYRTYQRNASDQATITVTGHYTGFPAGVEARWGSGEWAAMTAASGTFTGTFANQAAGQATLQVRLSDNTAITDSAAYVGIGDIFVCAGQSNMSGRGVSNQSYSHATLKAALFGNDYTWKELADPYDSNAGQVDSVSSDVLAAGSFIPPLATAIMASTGFPVAFIPCSLSGTAISQWAAGANHSDRTTLYGSMNYRTTQAGGARCVLWWQGERDAVLGTLEATYNTALDGLANNIQTDKSIKLMPCKLEDLSGYGYNEAAVNAAITTAYGDNANVLTGPDFSDLTPDGDGVHFDSNAELATVAGRWAAAIKTAFSWS